MHRWTPVLCCLSILFAVTRPCGAQTPPPAGDAEIAAAVQALRGVRINELPPAETRRMNAALTKACEVLRRNRDRTRDRTTAP